MFKRNVNNNSRQLEAWQMGNAQVETNKKVEYQNQTENK